MIDKVLSDSIKAKYNIDIVNDYLAHSYGNIVFCFDWSQKENAEVLFIRGKELATKEFDGQLTLKDFFEAIVIDNPISDIYGPENFIDNIKKDLSKLDIMYDLYVPLNLKGKTYWNSLFLRSLTTKNGESELIYGRVNFSTTKVPKAVLYYQNTYRDGYTGLYTKPSLELHIKQAKPTDHSYGIYFDLDNFKRINDVFGHNNGDVFLQELAQSFKKNKLKDTSYYRLGGDEFFIYMINCTEHDAYKMAQHIIYVVETLNAHGQQVEVSASVGIIPLIGNNIDFEKMMELADKTMYYSKGRGKGIISYTREV